MEKNEFQSTTCQSKQWRMLLDRTAQHTVKQNLDRVGARPAGLFRFFWLSAGLFHGYMPYLSNLIRFAGVVWEGLGDGSLQVWVTMEQGF